MKKKKRLLSAAVSILIILTAVIIFFVIGKTGDKDLIAKGVYAGEVSIGGMTKQEAALEVEKEVAGLRDKKITFYAGENKLETTAGELGLSWENPEIIEKAVKVGKSINPFVRYREKKELEQGKKEYKITYGIQGESLTKLLEDHRGDLDTEAVDAGLERIDGSFQITEGRKGVKVNIKKSVSGAKKFFEKKWDGCDAEVELAADSTKPKGTREELSKVKDLLGSFQTSYASSKEGRRQNVEVGTAKVNGRVLYPNEEFSMYEAASPFEKENGYAIGSAYENGKVIDSYGGGICQVSTTLYNAVIRAELEVTERFPHSMVVSYVNPAEDAAIAGTVMDLKFKNNMDAPIYIEGYTENSRVCFNIYGQETRAGNRKVSFQSEITSVTDPGVKYQAAGDQPVGYINVEQEEHAGYTAQLWKIVTIDGVEQQRELFNKSVYRPSAKIVLVGTASENAEAVAAMNAAIASQDEAAINAAAAQWNDAAINAAAQAAIQAAQEQEAREREEQEREEQEKEEQKEQSEKLEEGSKKQESKKEKEDE